MSYSASGSCWPAETGGLTGRGARGTICSSLLPTVLRDRVGGGVDGDLKLLVPQLGLASADVVVQAVGLVVQLQPLLANLEHGDAE